MSRKLIVAHHAPDLDAVAAVWLLKRFDSQHYADAKVGFVNPGDTITIEQAEDFNVQLHEVTHVDTGLGEFDHHQPERGELLISAASLVYDHICNIHPEYKDDKALQTIVEFCVEIDHFLEIHWPDPASHRYLFMIHELIRGLEFTTPNDDDAQLHFGMQCLDSVYASLNQHIRAQEILSERGEIFTTSAGQCMAVETHNDDVIKLAQKQGSILVIRKDPTLGHIRIKVRPDAAIDLKKVYEEIKSKDSKGTWYYHPSGKMLLNGSRKHRDQHASALGINEVIEIVKNVFKE